ncbi:hypothetical protein CP97_14686 [Aurantiacibacter atlanticus]|uniref:Uncharacterized protein n=1 Tax=Aurantiacibacter atlanticus TaxID=1648404 RepID=A0A161I9W1_9SPHN|nr:hypothetical protein CP97_14686 [Aurantiacibacter atlanticus]
MSYLGVVPAATVLGHPKGHSEAHMAPPQPSQAAGRMCRVPAVVAHFSYTHD